MEPFGKKPRPRKYLLEKTKHRCTILLCLNQHYANEKINSPSGQSFFLEGVHQYQHMEMLYAKYNFTPKHYLSVLFNNVGFKNIKTDNKMYNMQTFGAYYLGNGNLWNVGLSAYYQFGKTELGKKTSATLLSAVVDYKINKPSKIGFGIDYLSGDDTNKNTQTSTNVFNTLYGVNHKFYGSMDYFFCKSSWKCWAIGYLCKIFLSNKSKIIH